MSPYVSQYIRSTASHLVSQLLNQSNSSLFVCLLSLCLSTAKERRGGRREGERGREGGRRREGDRKREKEGGREIGESGREGGGRE